MDESRLRSSSAQGEELRTLSRPPLVRGLRDDPADGKPGKWTLFLAQTLAVSRLSWARRTHEPLLIIAPVVATLIFSLLLAFTWFQLPWEPASAPAYYRVLSLQAFYFTAVAIIGCFNIFANDRPAILPCAPEGSLRFPSAPVWVGRYVAELPLRFAQALMASFIIYPIVSMRPGVAHFMLYQLGLLLQAAGNTALGMCCSAASGEATLSIWLAVLGVLFNYLFSSIAYSQDRVTWILRWLRFLSPSFYADQTLIFSQFVGATFPDHRITGNDILNATGWLKVPLSISLLGALWMILFYNILGLLGLHLTTRPHLAKPCSSEGRWHQSA